MPNMIETAVSMLAATSIGATWASCATDIGYEAVLDRLGQIEPKVLFTVNGYLYKGKTSNDSAHALNLEKLPIEHKLLCGAQTKGVKLMRHY